MNASDVESVPWRQGIQRVSQTVGEDFKAPAATSVKSPGGNANDTSVNVLDNVHSTGDLSLSLQTRAPPVESPYSMANSTRDIPCVAYALELFLASHMLESEDYMHKGDPKK
jgi:hypothetical protein